MFNAIKEAVESNRDIILAAYKYIWKNPETGYREVKTSAYMEKAFEDLGYELVRAGDIPGFYTVLDTGKPGPEILVMGELDSLICPNHPEADPETGAVHCCGHVAQCAALLGVAAALKNPEITKNLCGKIRLCTTPAEELLEIEYRTDLRKKGIIKYYGGKTEFIRRGYFDGVDMAILVHTTVGKDFMTNLGSVGFVAKQITYKGKPAHAGGKPHLGINALYAANQGLNAINAIRETFQEPDVIRVHPIISSGGGAVNAIPDNVVVETYVRGKTFEAIERENKKVNRALCGAALSMGANVDIFDIPGYAPLYNSPELIEIASDALTALYPDKKLKNTEKYGAGSTDIGDISAIMPVVQPYAPGAIGTAHGADYYIDDTDSACIKSAAWQVAMLVMLLSDNGAKAKTVIDAYEPMFASKETYCEYIDSFFDEGDRITYSEKDAVVRL